MMAGTGVLGTCLAVPEGTRACLVRVALAVLVFACAAWAATQVPDESGPFVYVRGACDGDLMAAGLMCPSLGSYQEGWWPVDFLRMIRVMDTNLKLAGPPNDAPDLLVMYGENNVIDSLPAEIDVLGIDYDGDDVTVSIDLEVDPEDVLAVFKRASPLPADLVSIGTGDASKLASKLSDIHAIANSIPDARARFSLLFVGVQDLQDLTGAVRLTLEPGLEPGRYMFWAEISDGREHGHLRSGAETVGGQTYKRLPVTVEYEPGAKDSLPEGLVVPWHVSAAVAAAAVALLILPRLPAGGRILPRMTGRRYRRHCIIIGAAWFAASAAHSAAYGLASVIDNLMMLPASMLMMGSPVAYYVVSRPPCARGGPARAAASVALMALGLWAAFYMLYGIPISISVLPFMALLPVSGGCVGAALFWAGFRRACGPDIFPGLQCRRGQKN